MEKTKEKETFTFETDLSSMTVMFSNGEIYDAEEEDL